MNYPRKLTWTFLLCVICICALPQIGVVHAQDPGDRAAKFRGTWWSGMDPALLDDRLLNLKTLDGFGVGFTDGATLSAAQRAPVPYLRILPGGDEVFPPDDDTVVLDNLLKVTGAGYMVQAYCNCENFIGNNAEQFDEFEASWKNWCDTNPTAQAFINSQSYHTKAGFPDRPYMFCYAEFVLKYYSQQYGQYIDIWIFDDGHSMGQHGDNATNGNADDQRLYEAFANAARAGNDEIAVAFNNGRSTLNYNSYPFAHATRFDDFTFGHAFGGNNNHAGDPQFGLNYRHVTRMQETNGFVHDGGNWDWDDKIVGNFHSKLSTTSWKHGPNQAWEQDDFNQWNEEALSAGGMMTWGGSYNRPVTAYYQWVPDMLEALDNHLYERGISVNAPAPLLGDFDNDGDVDVDDIDLLSAQMGQPASANPAMDLNGDGNITLADHDLHITTLVQTDVGTGALIGDLNFDGDVDVSQFDSTTFTNVGDASILLSNLGLVGGASYADGDLNGDGDVDISEFDVTTFTNVGDASRLLSNLGQSQ